MFNKIAFTLCSLSLMVFGYGQQQPENTGFENWEDVGLNRPEPVEWSSIKTSDGGSIVNNLAPYVWDQSTDAHTGTYSVKLINASVLSIVAAGLMTNGRVHAELSGTGWVFTDINNSQWNTPLTQKPDSLVFWAKFTSVSGDIAQARAILHTGSAKIPDDAQTNWIASAQIDIPNSVSTWTRFSAPFNYLNGTTPQYILFVLNSAGFTAHIGSVAYFDDLELIYNEPELDLTAFLQGPYSGSNQMSVSLNPEFLPLQQPFNVAPWNYTGSEIVSSIPNAQVVDWILIEMRDASSAATATGATTIDRKAGFLLSDGSVVGTDGSGRLTAPLTISQNLYVVIWHRNHLGIMSANALVKTDGVYNYDFSATGSIYGSSDGYIQLESGILGMAGGDGNADGVVNDTDKNNFWSILVGKNGYESSDYNLNGQISNSDKNDIWLNNQTKMSQVPE